MSKAFEDLSEKIFYLEQRVARLEAERKSYYIPSPIEQKTDEEIRSRLETEVEEQIESSIGEYGLAWIGNIVLFFGIIFLIEYMRISGLKILSQSLGIAAGSGIFFLAQYFRKVNPNMAKIFNLNGYLLVFYVAIKMHFFTPDPLIANKGIGLILLLGVTGSLLYISIKRKYSLLAELSLIFTGVTAVLSDSTHIMLPLASAISLISFILLYRMGWTRILFLSILLVYTIHLLWIFHNPFMGHSFEALTVHQYGFVHLFTAMAIFSLIALLPEKKEFYNSGHITGATVLNGFGFALLTTINIVAFFKDHYYLPVGIIAFFLIVYAIILNEYSYWKITAGLYALSGFVALSLYIHAIYNFPNAYFLLAIQSLLVVTIAIWFRSKFIVVMNSLMYLFLLTIYLFTSDSGDGINIAFSLVALTTARILNWKRERLTIQTDLIRNLYMIIAFFMVLYTLFHLVPKHYITFSWTIAAVLYFLISLLLKNVKYRYMALGTMIFAAFYLFVVDLANVELLYRVIALLFLSIISIILSFYYYNKKKMKEIQD
jgi:hypothetical protein